MTDRQGFWINDSKTASADRWFRGRGWEPFPFQREVWAACLAGECGLVHAPTGTGKTYAVWFGALLRMLSRGSGGGLRVLWITPLRALAGDIREALQQPLGDCGLGWKVEVRTGDTPSHVKARQRRSLPEVLITTPESLSLFLSYPETRQNFRDLDMVVVDEWHELLGSKRGVQTELALARLRHWRPEILTWGLSATLGNLETAAEVLMGSGSGCGRIHRGILPKEVQIETVIPAEMERFPWAGHLGIRLLNPVVEAIEGASSTLVFTNTRSHAETWFQAILNARPEWAGEIAVHHGSIAGETRQWVEDGLRQGRLRCVVCTSSLDLGVDFSPVDQVIQIGSSKGVGRLLQRAGRSGHQPGGVSRILCIPTHALELIEVAALRGALLEGQVESRNPMDRPLDVLAQHLITIATGGGFQSQSLYREVRSTYSYRKLSRKDWQWVLGFVCQGSRSLSAYDEFRRVTRVGRVYQVREERAAQRHRISVGTITSDQSMEVRYTNNRKLGQVEEHFVSRMRPGDRFTFGGQVLEFLRIRQNVAYVRRSDAGRGTIPRWTGGRMPLSAELSSSVREALAETRSGVFRSPELEAVRELLDLQRAWSRIPGTDEVLVEITETREGHHLFVFPFEGRLVHEGLASLVACRLSRVQPLTLTLSMNDYGFEVLSGVAVDFEKYLGKLFSGNRLLDDIRSSLNAVEMARRQFREVARVAGLVFEGYPGRRKPGREVQVSSGLLFDVFRKYEPDNLLIRQAEREVLESQLEQSRLKEALTRIRSSRIVVTRPPRPTPFAFPLVVDRLRDQVSSESFESRVRRMVVQLEAYARE